MFCVGCMPQVWLSRHQPTTLMPQQRGRGGTGRTWIGDERLVHEVEGWSQRWESNPRPAVYESAERCAVVCPPIFEYSRAPDLPDMKRPACVTPRRLVSPAVPRALARTLCLPSARLLVCYQILDDLRIVWQFIDHSWPAIQCMWWQWEGV